MRSEDSKMEGGPRTRGKCKKSTPEMPLISVITVVLNGEKHLEQTILSVLNQTYNNIEYIIIDGGSTDKTLDILKKYEDRIDYWVSEPDKGISDAFNKGLKLASGDIIAVLNSDDYYAHNNAIHHVVEIFVSKPDIKMIYGKVRCVEQETGKTLVMYGEPFSLKKMRKGIITPHPALFAKREVYETVGPFSLDYKVCMDYDFFLRATHLYEPYFIDEVLTIMRWGGFSTRNIYRGHNEAYKVLRANGIDVVDALINLIYRYTMTSLSLALRKLGLESLVFLYRKRKGQL